MYIYAIILMELVGHVQGYKDEKGDTMNLEQEKFWKEYRNKEEKIRHMSYEAELYYYQAVANGDLHYINAVSQNEHFEQMEGLGTLSGNSIKNIQYHYVISVSLAARACIDGGMPLEESFGLADFYIQQLDFCKDALDIDKLTRKMNMDYTKRMYELKKDRSYSKNIQKCMNYIYQNLHGTIRISELAEYVNRNKSHLSRQFKEETGITIQDYITQKKIQEAKGMLKYTDFTCNEIALNLGFSSHSHFTKVFKNLTGVTPKLYKSEHGGKADFQ